MKKALIFAVLLIGALSFVATDAMAGWCPGGGGGGAAPGGRSGGGGISGGGGGVSKPTPSTTTWGGTTAYGGSMGWVTSKGKAAPQATGQDSKKSQEELFEVKEARQELKPVLIFFAKGRDVLNFGKKSKDREVETTAHFEKEIFGRLAITGMAKEFVNIKVDVRKADRKLLTKTYYIRKAPVVVILDFYGKVVYRLSSPKLNYRQLGKMMESAIKRVEKEVKNLAKSNEDSDLCKRAKARFAEIEMRDTLAKGLEYTYDKKWAKAEKALKDVLDRKEDNEYKKKAEAGMKELQAGKLFVEGERLYKKKRYKQSKEILDKVIKIRESKYFKQLATNLLKKVNKKIR